MATNPTQTPTDPTPTTAADALLDALADFLVESFKQHLIRRHPHLAVVFDPPQPPKAKPGCIILKLPVDPILPGCIV
jgi:hypothetical protein